MSYVTYYPFPRALALALGASLGLSLAGLILSGLASLRPNGVAWAMPAPSPANSAVPHPATNISVTTFTDEINDDGDCSLREALRAANLNAAVDACPAGSGADVVFVPSGLYTLTRLGTLEDAGLTGDLDLTDPAGLTLMGAGEATTVINANRNDRVLQVVAGAGPTTLRDLTLQFGMANEDGGGIYAASALTLSHTSVLSNSGYAGGGGYFAQAVNADTATFRDNSAFYGGGAYFSGPAQIHRTTFHHNIAYVYGGGAAFNTNATVLDSSFSTNTSENVGGGGAFFRGPAYVTDTVFSQNAGRDSGGGALFITLAEVQGSTFNQNNAFSFGGNSAYGGGAFFQGASTVSGTTFTGNWADRGGGAVFVSMTQVLNTAFIANLARQSGGGVYLYGVTTSTEQLVNTLLAANTAGEAGAALYALHTGGDDTLTLQHTTIASPTVGSGAAVAIFDGTAYITNTLVASYTLGFTRTAGLVVENYNLFSGVTTPYAGGITSGGNSFTGTAAFYETQRYTLHPTSGAHDIGTPSEVNTDFEGDPRPTGQGFDIGWDEMVYKRYLPLIWQSGP